jgi:hypothetical protein
LDDYATVADRDLAKAIEAARERGESAPGFTWRRPT